MIQIRIAETGELKPIPQPFAIKWKERLGKMTWDPVGSIYVMTEQQYQNEMRAAKHNKLVGVLVLAAIVYLVVMGY